MNHAYATLKSPLQRAIYLVRDQHNEISLLLEHCCVTRLRRQDIAVFPVFYWVFWVLKNLSDSCCNSQLKERGFEVDEGEGTIEDPEFLMEIMELREKVEELSDPIDLQEFRSANRSQEAACIQVP